MTLRLDPKPLVAANQLATGLDGVDRPLAVIALEPSLAHEVASYAAGRRWDVRADILVMGVGAAEPASEAPVGLPALIHPTEDMAAEAVNCVVRRIEQPPAPVAHSDLDYALRWSQSSEVGKPAGSVL